MCGISCILSLPHDHAHAQHHHPLSQHLPNGASNGTAPTQQDTRGRLSAELDASLAQIKHRGPDSSGQWISDDNRVALGHVRLSINDLSTSGAQPFHSPSRKVHAVVNGEFYDYDRIRAELEASSDYAFTSRSDSEIAIALYLHHGLNFPQFLRGEFACIIYDEERQLFIAVRDRYGIKPLFWTVRKGRLLVAAEMKAFLPLGWEPEWDVRSLKDAGWNHDTRTVFTGVQKIRPGHYLTCQSFGHIDERPYWDSSYPDKQTVDPRTPSDLILGVRERLLEAVRLRLRADVPVGIYLSGGIDSSVIAGMVAHLVKQQNLSMGSAPPSERVTCFSIAFDADSGFDESAIANRTAEWLGVKYIKKLMNEEELALRFEDAVWHCEHHNPDLNFVGKFALSEVPQAAGYKVVLTGEGADEIFAGYPLFLPDYLREPDHAWAAHNPLQPSDREHHLELAERRARDGYRIMGGACEPSTPSLPSRMLNNISTLTGMTAFQPDVFAPWTDTAYGTCSPALTIASNADGLARARISSLWHPLHAALYVWSKGHLPNIFLSCLGDRTEMAHSIEARTPFLDHKLAEYVNNAPPSAKLHWVPEEGRFVEKWLLREAARPFITEELYQRAKHPYSAPTRFPRDGPLGRLLGGLLTKEKVEGLGFVSWDKVKDLMGLGFGEDGDARAWRLALVIAEWVVLGERFGVKRAVA